MMSGRGDESLKSMSVSAYSAAADTFDDPVLSFWDRFGRETVRRAALRPGDRVLDACCGTGASAIPAAQAVGPAGRVLGIDIAEPPLGLARAKATSLGLSNVEFRATDVEASGLPSASFDAVVCVFGIFFLPDITAAVRELWRLVRPGGTLAVTVWGPRWLEPGTAAFWQAVGAEDPALVGGFHPWTRITDAAGLRDVFAAAGARVPAIEEEPGTHPLTDPEDWWKIVLGTGYRATVTRLVPAAADRVRRASVEHLRQTGARELQVNVVYARSRR